MTRITQRSDCCKAPISFDKKLDRPECFTCSRCCRVIGSPMTTLNTTKKWFEENFLDGDEVQDGQMLSSKACLEAVAEREAEVRREMVEWIDEENYSFCEHEKGGLFISRESLQNFVQNHLSNTREKKDG